MRLGPVVVIGIGEDGCLGLSARAFNAVARCQILVGGERHLEFFPDFPGRRVVLGSKVKETLRALEFDSADKNIVILASGDPLFFGVGRLALEVFGAAYVSFIPHLASIQLAFAAAKIPWADARLLSVHGRSLEGLVTRSRRERKLALLTDAEQCPQRIADHLITFHDTAWQATLCEDLGGVDERVRSLSLEDLRQLPQVHPLNVLLLERPTSWKAPSPLLYAEEAAFAKRMPKLGLITKREIRLLSLGALRLQDDSVIWDIGAGSGSVGIEAALLAAEGRCYAIECDAEGQDICMANMKQFGADNVRLIPGRAPDVLDGLEDPDAVFVGGSKGRLEEILATSWARLKPQGRLVVNAITLENVSAAIRFFKESSIAYDMQLVQIARSQDLAGIYHRYEALNPIHIFAATKGEHAAAR